MTVIKVSADVIAKMKQHYAPYLKATSPAHSVFAAQHNGTTITAYQSGKVLFQGNSAQQEAALWSDSIEPTSPSANLPANFQTLSVVGSDEVGNGSYFGSLVVCAAFVEASDIAQLQEMGVQDSKNLTDTRIKELAKQLKARLSYQITEVLPEKYNAIQPTMSQGKMKAILHNHTLMRLLEKIAPVTPDAILIDQFELPSTYYKHIQDKSVQIRENVYFATKGESHHLAVAAASIMARATFLETLDRLSVQAGRTLPSGAGNLVDEVAAQLITQQGVDSLTTFSKLHFANTQKALKLARK